MNTNILFIDDDADDYEIFEEIAKEIDPGINVTYVSDCENVADYLKPPFPDIIFLDYNMPKMNGIECLKALRNKEQLNDVPIVIYSVYFDKVQLAFENGANYFIVKQVTSERIKSSINSALNRNWKDKNIFKNFEVIFRADQFSDYNKSN